MGRVASQESPVRTSLAASLLLSARHRASLSQRELARRAGVSRTTVVEVESGRRDPGLETLRRMLRAADADLDIRLVDVDDHDRVLATTLDALPSRRRQEMQANFDRFVSGLAAGLSTSRPLTNPDEQRAS